MAASGSTFCRNSTTRLAAGSRGGARPEAGARGTRKHATEGAPGAAIIHRQQGALCGRHRRAQRHKQCNAGTRHNAPLPCRERRSVPRKPTACRQLYRQAKRTALIQGVEIHAREARGMHATVPQATVPPGKTYRSHAGSRDPCPGSRRPVGASNPPGPAPRCACAATRRKRPRWCSSTSCSRQVRQGRHSRAH